MATEKKEKTVKDTAKESVEKKEKTVKDTAKESVEKKEKTVKVHIPVDPLNPKDKEIIIGINEKYAKVVRGEETEVSMPVYLQLKNAGLV